MGERDRRIEEKGEWQRMNVKNERIKNCEGISKELWNEGKDEYEYIGVVGSLNKDNAMQFVDELEDFINRWDWRILHCTRRIEEHRSR